MTKTQLKQLIREEIQKLNEGSQIDMSTASITKLYLTKQLDRDYKNAVATVSKIEDIKSNINGEITKLISMLKEIQKKYNVEVTIEADTASGGAKFHVKVMSEPNDALYADLQKVTKHIASAKSIGMKSDSQGRGDIEHFNWYPAYIFWVA